MNSRCVPHLPLHLNPAESRILGGLGWRLYRFGLIGGGILWICIACTMCGCTNANGWVMNQSGRAYYSRGNYTAARYEFERALIDNPYNASYAYNVARSMEKQGDVAGAEQMYQHAISLDPSHQPSYHALSSMLAMQGRQNEAQGLLQAWAATQPYTQAAQAELAQFQGSGAMAAGGLPGGMQMGMAPGEQMDMNSMAAMESSMTMGPDGQPMAMDPHGHPVSMGAMNPQQQPVPMGSPYQQVSMTRARGASMGGGSAALQMANSMPQHDPTLVGGPIGNVYSQPGMAGMPPQMMGPQPQVVNMPPQAWEGQMAGTAPMNATPGNGMQPASWVPPNSPIPQQSYVSSQGRMLAAPAVATPMQQGQPVELGQPQPLTQVVPNTNYPMMSGTPMIQAF